jgi:EAL domain-containing protein (putative c-di-GMP-specific phosphodiesterase class I)
MTPHYRLLAVASIAACGLMLTAWLSLPRPHPAAAATAAPAVVDTLPVERAMESIRGAWLDELDQLIFAARSLAVADDTDEFVARPNLPYVSQHYTLDRLAAARIDTVLIVDRKGAPLFWRRVTHARGRGFADARDFLAELPPFAAPAAVGAANLAGVLRLAQGPSLVVAMPIHAASHPGDSPGWLIITRALDAAQWARYLRGIPFSVDVLDPQMLALPRGVEEALRAPLAFVMRVDKTYVRGLMAVPGADGRPFRVISLRMPKVANAAAVAADAVAPGAFWPSLTVILGGAAAVLLTILLRRQRPGPPATAVPPAAAPQDPQTVMEERLAALECAYRFQPQIDLQTGRIAGVEAQLCAPNAAGGRAADPYFAGIEDAGLGFALAECRLRAACREQRAWLREIGHDFPISVPVSRRTLENPELLPLIKRVLAENELAPRYLEIEVAEEALAASGTALRAISDLHRAGIAVAIDGFNAVRSSLGLLTLVPIAKLRIDPALTRKIGIGTREAVLFDGILGAARGLGIQVCATGVDSADVLAAILAHARPLAQGSAVGEALGADEFLARLRGCDVETKNLTPSDFAAVRVHPRLATGPFQLHGV